MDGAHALFGDLLRFDCILVCVNGYSVVRVSQGVPEGGLVGPLAFILVPDILVKELYSRGFGFGLDAVVPEAWKDHVWVGSGTPQDDLVQECMVGLQGDGPLPSSDELDASISLEASALRAMDKLSSIRVVAVLHADDPVFVDSTRGGLQQVADVAADWAFKWKATFHTGATKNVVQVGGDCFLFGVGLGLGLRMPVVGGVVHDILHCEAHKWLGFLWRMDLDFRSALQGKVRHADGLVATLSGLVSGGSLPLAVAVSLFEGKVDGYLRSGRWLMAVAWDAEATYDEAYYRWARGSRLALVWVWAGGVGCCFASGTLVAVNDGRLLWGCIRDVT